MKKIKSILIILMFTLLIILGMGKNAKVKALSVISEEFNIAITNEKGKTISFENNAKAIAQQNSKLILSLEAKKNDDNLTMQKKVIEKPKIIKVESSNEKVIQIESNFKLSINNDITMRCNNIGKTKITVTYEYKGRQQESALNITVTTMAISNNIMENKEENNTNSSFVSNLINVIKYIISKILNLFKKL